ncbi:hypothetical protein NUH88_20330 [Nisaea acidiphila]|uniref:DUF1080 domain-containing protein n=1 Tax=Nisaea acidiphila TaxID=1862145 RepID=A0A9J7ATT2_9PROT|nr:hypothetical protein [Nisaea acidiphila]UUX49732.1 hypothetical protein NUH88_20330 [Nisaea acidiphila]
MQLKAIAKCSLAAAVMTVVLSAAPQKADAYDPRGMTGPGFLALADGRLISGWMTEGNRVFYFKLEKRKVYSMHIPAQNGFEEFYETGTVRPTKEHYCLTPFNSADERCLKVRLLENNEFETTDDDGNRIARWWLAAQ